MTTVKPKKYNFQFNVQYTGDCPDAECLREEIFERIQLAYIKGALPGDSTNWDVTIQLQEEVKEESYGEE